MILASQIVTSDCASFCAALFCTRTAAAAENLILPKQLPLLQGFEKAQVTIAADRFVLSKPALFFDWRDAALIVEPATLSSWHRGAFSANLDEMVESWGIHVLRSPVHMPTANAH